MANPILQPPNCRGVGLDSLRIANEYESRIKEEGAPAIEKVVTWRCYLTLIDELEKSFAEHEDVSIINQYKEQHEIILGFAIILGKYLLKLEGIEEALKEISCTMEDLKSKIQMLEYKNAMWHSELSKDQEKSDKILEDIFCDA